MQPSTQLFLDYLEHKLHMQTRYPDTRCWSFEKFCSFGISSVSGGESVMAMVADRPRDVFPRTE